MNYEEEYEKLIDAYRRKFLEVRKAEKKREDQSIILFLDKERNDIHNELRRIGSYIGKTAQDITFDILISDKDLKEYGLPEFKVLKTKRALWSVDYVSVIDDVSHKEVFKPETISDDLEVFVPFVQQEFWHLFDDEGYPYRHIDELERRRRMAKIVELMNGAVRSVEVYSGETFHRGTLLAGIAFSTDVLEKVLTTMFAHKKEISIDESCFDKEQLHKDALAIIREDLEYIVNRDSGEEANYHIKRYHNSIDRLGWYANIVQEAEHLFDRAFELAEQRMYEEEVESEMTEWDEIQQQYPKKMELPKNQPMKRM